MLDLSLLGDNGNEEEHEKRLAIWVDVCRSFFYKNEERYNQTETICENHVAELVMNLFEMILENSGTATVVVPINDKDAKNVIQKMGIVQQQEQQAEKRYVYVLDSAWVEKYRVSRDHTRHQVHAELAVSRYQAFQEEFERIANQVSQEFVPPTQQEQVDLERQQQTRYYETEQMASSQRDDLAQFIKKYGQQDIAQPFLNGLHKALETQLGNQEKVVTWTLDDAALVERGHMFGSEAVKLMLHVMRFQVGNVTNTTGEPKDQSRQLIMDPQLSDRRIAKLLAHFPRSCGSSKVPVSGQITFHPTVERINVDGQYDAYCPQDSILYLIQSKCDIL